MLIYKFIIRFVGSARIYSHDLKFITKFFSYCTFAAAPLFTLCLTLCFFRHRNNGRTTNKAFQASVFFWRDSLSLIYKQQCYTLKESYDQKKHNRCGFHSHFFSYGKAIQTMKTCFQNLLPRENSG